MRMLVFIAAFLIALACPAETLRSVLQANGIPEDTFKASELAGEVNASAAEKDGRVLVVYMRLDKKNLFTGNPQLIQFSRDSGRVIQAELKPPDPDLCCGSPEDISFIDDYAIVPFHFNPSAETMLVVGKDLKVVEALYGFDAHQVGPGQIVFIENMIHFAAQHPERLRFADLRTRTTEELYPIKDDVLRSDFVELHRRHMPAESDCQRNNDPCDPSIFDETIDFLPGDSAGGFRIRVTRDAAHPGVTENDIEGRLFQEADYRFQRRMGDWYFCSREHSIARLIKGAEPANPRTNADDCEPNLPVVNDADAGQPSPFPTEGKKVK